MLKCFVFCSLVCFGGAIAYGDNEWANWRGPNYDGSLEEASPPLSWSANQNIKWKVRVPGKGSGSPIVWGDRIYLTTAAQTERLGSPDMQGVPPGPDAGGPPGAFSRMNNEAPKNYFQFMVLAYDRATGNELWRKVVKEAVPHESGHATNSYASGSPVTDGKHIYASFGSFGVHCLTVDGELVWSTDLGKMTTRNAFGEASTPALHGETLVVPWDQDGYEDKNGNGQRDEDEHLSSIVALDTKSGSVNWRTPRPTEPTTWATPLIIESGGRTQVVTNGTTVRSYDLYSGQLLWECGGQVTNPIPSPIRVGDSVVCMTGYRGNAVFSLALDGSGKLDGTDKVNWSRSDAAPYVASATLYKGQLYLTKSRDGIVTSVNAATGQVVFPETRMSGIRDMYASPVAAGDRIYFTGRDGTTTVLKHGQQYEELAVNQLGEPVDASPALCDNEIYIRGVEHMYCIAQE